jgi:type IV secretory pathway VirB6-like protein
MCYISPQLLIGLIVVLYLTMLVVIWIIFSLILSWGKPALYDGDNVNWWTSFWVIAVTYLIYCVIAWIYFSVRYRLVTW